MGSENSHRYAKTSATRIVLHMVDFDALNHPPYSAELAPRDYYLFPKMTKELRNKKFINDNEVNAAVSAYFKEKEEIFF